MNTATAINKPIFNIPGVLRKVINAVPANKQDDVTTLIHLYGTKLNTTYSANEAMELHVMKQAVSDISATRECAEAIKKNYPSIAALLAAEIRDLQGLQTAQKDALIAELTDSGRDGNPLPEGLAGAQANQSQVTTRKRQDGNLAETPALDHTKVILGIFNDKEPALYDAALEATKALFTLKEGNGVQVILEIINKAAPIPNNKNPKLTTEEIKAELNSFAEGIKNKTSAEFKTAFEALNPESQQALKYISTTKLSIVFNQNFAALSAPTIKSDTFLNQTFMAKLEGASPRDVVLNESQDIQIHRQAKFYQELNNLISNYHSQKRSIEGIPELAKQDRIKSINQDFSEGIDKLLGDKPLTQDEIKHLKHQISIASTEKKPGEAAEGTHDFLNKVFSAQGLTLATMVLSVIPQLISFIPGIGKTVAGWAQLAADWSTKIAQGYISLRGLTNKAGEA